ncbi:flagellar brake domain-containing protein [Paenibacillus sp. KQZ6P-2]|uniref:Flagellar brake domain-containing protein n=1 Tax=Paenibacillus mangrovi TaxID=2931978 RepID=A0A9X1WLE4_9BACL|nr:flagellar brake domain-containing protein [Paenibacillus mangrovi]MCJ8011108.1 flagellar brake domain-containing protein [Paenibacillus mangrovi]
MYPKIGDLLFISVDSGDEKEAVVQYKSRIGDMDEDSILIEVPIQEGSGRLKKLSSGDELSVFFLTEGGIKNYFNSYVFGFKEDVIRMIRIRRPEPDSISKIQRRSFLRVNAELEVAVKTDKMLRFVARTYDVGGGGLSFYCDASQRVSEGDGVSCWVLVLYKNGSIEHVPFNGEIVRIKVLENGRKIVMVKFTAIADMERQKLIRFCFERQFDFRR